jgi:hypothetical protein
MARHDNGPPIWHGAVEQAPFDFYEPDTVGDRWAGGFSANGSHIGVAGTIDGFTVVVDTSGRERTLSKPLERRASMSDLLWHHLMSGDTDITLPYWRSIEADNRTARLAQTPTAFTGNTWPATIDGSAASRSVMCACKDHHDVTSTSDSNPEVHRRSLAHTPTTTTRLSSTHPTREPRDAPKGHTEPRPAL